MAGKSKEYDIAFKLSGLVDPSLKRSVGSAEEHIQELEWAIKELSQNGGFDRLRKDAEKAEGVFDDLKDRAESFGETLNRVAEFTGAKALIDMATGSLQDIVGVIGDQDNAMAQLQASTGMTAQQMEEMNAIAKDMYKQNYGEGFDDLGAAMAAVKQTTQQTGDELEQTTKTAIAFRDVFEEDIPESVKAADTLMKQFGITSGQSYNLMAQGAQKGLNKAGDLLDTTNEYAVYFKTMGYNANEMFDMFSAGMENGAFNLDKVADSVKEFGIRIKDGSDSTGDAIFTLFQAPDVTKFSKALTSGGEKTKEYAQLVKLAGKDTASVMTSQLKKGGAVANAATKRLRQILGSGQQLLDGISKGSISGRQAMEQVINKLKDIKDPVEQSTLAVALFGTQWEDMESSVVLALGNARSQFDMTKQTMEEVAKVKYDTLTRQFQTVGRELMTELVIPIGEDLMPALQDVAHWASDNKDLLEMLALGAPAAMVGKNAFKLISKITKVGAAAEGAAGAAGGFGEAIGLLTNPVGLAVTGVGILTAGIIAYKKHQSEARKDLLNMGDAIEAAFSTYEELDHTNKRTQNLVAEYDRLTKKIKDSKTPAAELTEARRKLKGIEQELIDMNPKILDAEGSKSEKFRDQLGLVQDINAAQAEMGRRELEHAALEAEGKMPELERTYSGLADDLEKQNAAYEKAKKTYAEYVAYMSQLQKIEMSNVNEDEKSKQRNALASQIKETTGKDYSNAWVTFKSDFKDIEASFDVFDKRIQDTEKEMGEAQDSFLNYYELKSKMIEEKLGGSLEEMAAKYKNMSDAEKKRFDQAMKDMAELNQEVDLMPDEKKINLQLIWEQTGQIPNFDLTDSDWKALSKTIKTGGTPNLRTPSGVKINRLAQHDPGFEGFADGGIATKPSIFGEAGPEIAIPLNNKPRSHALLDAANDMMGHSNGGGGISASFSFSITVNGGGLDVASQVKKAIQDLQPTLERQLVALAERRERVSMRR
ncbi:phage tail tape measure protein [Paenibacillus durus]|uniref:Phage tail tape measure protein domain-containing protein n=1 Tax=Paenibacillus durus ATCC 35681 TaxID=1333534 RepID=A0A0F7CIH9_PAEDU|nr:phage tail tape measure protein [Paenibacillus durus]AKG34665.1 hypothetical protein VK70_08805 [Paenibacillus durus ATCC 35681]